MSANSSPFVCSQCNNSSKENSPSRERTEREVAVTGELDRTLFWTSGRTTTGSSAGRSEVKRANQNRLFAPHTIPKVPGRLKGQRGLQRTRGWSMYLQAVCWMGCEPHPQHQLQPHPRLLWPLLPLESLKGKGGGTKSEPIVTDVFFV